MEDIYYSPLMELLSRWILGVVFLWACYYKIIEPASFAKMIYGYKLFPHYSINLSAIILPYIEFYTGLALLLGVYPRTASMIINCMLFVFIVAISINLIRGHSFDCGCFSFGKLVGRTSAISLVIRDVVLFIMGLQVIFFNKPRKWCLLQSGGLLKDIRTHK